MSRLIKSTTSCQKNDSIKSKNLAETRNPKVILLIFESLLLTLPWKRKQKVPEKCAGACEVIL